MSIAENPLDTFRGRGLRIAQLEMEIDKLRKALEDVVAACDAECAGCGAYYVAKKALEKFS